MSATHNLTQAYGRFFVGCADLAIKPYTFTYHMLFSDNNWDKASSDELIYAAVTYAFLAFTILPIATEITIDIALTVATLAALTMMFTYPIALIHDLINHESNHSYDSHGSYAFA